MVIRCGLSPRLRGNHQFPRALERRIGSIPAPAGEPCGSARAGRARRVYPRACGGTGGAGNGVWDGRGLSPRLRGNLADHRLRRPVPRSIPAPAGEPRSCWSGRARMWVYPRACGGTKQAVEAVQGRLGLSPRLRGNLAIGPSTSPTSRSIPAPAGEPNFVGTLPGRWSVYPRACGGTPFKRRRQTAVRGLSPRLRGNLSVDEQTLPCVGSIPAPAGEPPLVELATFLGRVYPRACGGTPFVVESPMSYRGLSPRLRGNLRHTDADTTTRRSIPAPAGEPRTLAKDPAPARVYPRACGGTTLRRPRQKSPAGLSPRLRGNLGILSFLTQQDRSIPAPAGEPRFWPLIVNVVSVYPRACGGTRVSLVNVPAILGLSPRLRGNHDAGAISDDAFGSIPAPAGEPLPRIVYGGLGRVNSIDDDCIYGTRSRAQLRRARPAQLSDMSSAHSSKWSFAT